MSALIDEWIAKAEGDFRTAAREIEVEADPNYDAVCYHAQQCIEKLMKALLIAKGLSAPRTHDLAYLASLLAPAYPGRAWPAEDLIFLTRAAVEFRYSGESAEYEEAAEAFAICKSLRQDLLPLFER